MRTRAARLYVSPRTRPLTAEEQEVRRIAYALKTAEPEAVAIAAREMARLIDGACWLVPVPTSRGSINGSDCGEAMPGKHVVAEVTPDARSQPWNAGFVTPLG